MKGSFRNYIRRFIVNRSKYDPQTAHQTQADARRRRQMDRRCGTINGGGVPLQEPPGEGGRTGPC
jgi:hypothetical protein